MKRKLLFIERMLHGDGNNAFNVLVPAKIRGSFQESTIRLALEKLQEKHAWLNASVKDDEKGYPWFVVDKNNPLKIQIRTVTRRSDEDWQSESVREWSTPFNNYQGPLMRVVWVKGDAVSEIILVMHHCLFDGRSVMSILGEFLQLLDNVNADIAQEKAITNIADVVPAHILNSKKHRIKSRLIMGAASLALSLIPTKNNQVERKKDYLIHWKLDKDTSAAFISFCKAEGITVNTAICGAILSAFKQVRQEKALNKILCPVDIRSFNKQIKQNNIFAFALMVLVSAYPGLDFLSNARAMQKDIDKKMSKLDPYNIMLLLEAAHGSLDKIVDFLKNQKPGNDCLLSNLGRIEIPYQYNSFEVETIFSISVIGPLGNTTAFTTSTYRGQMDFSFISSEGFITHAEGLSIKNKVLTTIKEQINYPTIAVA
ncbi:condensation domain-containing protein [Mucilaginibacter sp. SP1R1]|uniref:condensation domain-containing protein n=1 Tax=Mucilaginibacter sp. SP1R1 TaxID=2723091 RepID=UPI001613FA2F|nr:condensation domain-containing protein [Mucilaginibacter sp. SP1R1]MBB6149022.1 NRPS condensation-like uncharacterized protein [Mucilaginibacter sp. SP1R1]